MSRKQPTSIAQAATTICRLLELGDNRLMASDGPCGGQLPDLSPDEWGEVYDAAKFIAKKLPPLLERARTHRDTEYTSPVAFNSAAQNIVEDLR